MSNVPFINTKFINGFVGNDRPIYGNELIPNGGCLPNGYSRKLVLDSSSRGEIVFWEMDEYSGGSLTSCYTNLSGGDLVYYTSYQRNAPLSGVTYAVYQGYVLSNPTLPVYLIYSTDLDGYIFWSHPTTPSVNPIYGGNATGAILSSTTYLLPPVIVDGRGYPPPNLYESNPFSVSATITFDESCISLAPTPTITPGYFGTATPTPTPTRTLPVSQTPTLTPTISVTPSITPSGTPGGSPTPTPSPSASGFQYIYQVVNCDDGGDIRNFGSNAIIPLGKVVKGADISICFEVLGTGFSPINDFVTATYQSCGSCPR